MSTANTESYINYLVFKYKTKDEGSTKLYSKVKGSQTVYCGERTDTGAYPYMFRSAELQILYCSDALWQLIIPSNSESNRNLIGKKKSSLKKHQPSPKVDF